MAGPWARIRANTRDLLRPFQASLSSHRLDPYPRFRCASHPNVSSLGYNRLAPAQSGPVSRPVGCTTRGIQSGCSAVASALRSGPRGLYYGINFRLTSGCSAVASALRSGRRGRWFESTHPGYFFALYRHTYDSSYDNFAIPEVLGTADHSGQLVFPV